MPLRQRQKIQEVPRAVSGVLGVPQDSREAFGLLQANGLQKLADSMKRMVGFRKVAVHEYADVKLDIVKSIITQHLDEFLAFSQRILRLEA